jgi:hypothetical protein
MNRFSVILNGMIFCPTNGLPPFFERPGLLALGACAATRAANVRAKAKRLIDGKPPVMNTPSWQNFVANQDHFQRKRRVEDSE